MATNRQIADAFRKAKRRVTKHDHDYAKERYICHAVADATILGGWEATKIVMKRLYTHNSLEQWLESVMDVPRWNLDYNDVQTHRHQWLDMLIKEYSK